MTPTPVHIWFTDYSNNGASVIKLGEIDISRYHFKPFADIVLQVAISASSDVREKYDGRRPAWINIAYQSHQALYSQVGSWYRYFEPFPAKVILQSHKLWDKPHDWLLSETDGIGGIRQVTTLEASDEYLFRYWSSRQPLFDLMNKNIEYVQQHRMRKM